MAQSPAERMGLLQTVLHLLDRAIGLLPVEWAERGRALLADLFLGRSEDERQVLQALDEALSRWLRDCDLAGFDRPVPLAVAREAWLGALDELFQEEEWGADPEAVRELTARLQAALLRYGLPATLAEDGTGIDIRAVGDAGGPTSSPPAVV